jgi:hypothetical protein
MVDHVGEKLSGRRLGFHALQQLIARRAQELDLMKGKRLLNALMTGVSLSATLAE